MAHRQPDSENQKPPARRIKWMAGLSVAILVLLLVGPIAVLFHIHQQDAIVSEINRKGGRATSLCDWIRLPFYDNEAVPVLVRLNALERPSYLEFIRNPGDKSLQIVGKMSWLESLSIEDCNGVTDVGIKKLGSLRQLKRLSIVGTMTGDRGLASISQIASLESLTLRNTRITDAGVPTLTNLEHIKYLQLSGDITDDSLSTIAKLTTLEEVKFVNCRLSNDAISELRRKRPHLRVVNEIHEPLIPVDQTTIGQARSRQTRNYSESLS